LKSESLGVLDNTIDGHPSHDLRIGKVSPLVANLPDTCVRFHPHAFQMLHERQLHVPARFACGEAAAPRLVIGVHHLAEYIELDLTERGVADSHRHGIFVARQPRQRAFMEKALAGNAVHDLNLIGAAGNGAQQPFPPGERFLVETGVHQGEQGPCRIAKPTIAVIPVARAADLLRQGCRRRRNDAAGRAVGQRLERDERTHDEVGPPTRGPASRRPLAPKGLGLLEQRPWIGRFRRRQIRRRIGHDKRNGVTGLDNELADRRQILAA
jgi:hypothetical protein